MNITMLTYGSHGDVQPFILLSLGLMKHALEIGADLLRRSENVCSDADRIVDTIMDAVGDHILAREKTYQVFTSNFSQCLLLPKIIQISVCQIYGYKP